VVGTNPADDVAVILAAHRNPFTLEWSDEMLVDVNPPLLPVDTPPWWRVKKKAGHFYNGMSRGDHRGTMMFASSLCVDTSAQASEMLEYFADIRCRRSSWSSTRPSGRSTRSRAQLGLSPLATKSCPPCCFWLGSSTRA
jgi:hypothetical protein